MTTPFDNQLTVNHPMLNAIKKSKNLVVNTTMHFSRKALGFLWDKQAEIDPAQFALIKAIYNKKKKNSLEGFFPATYKLSKSKAGDLGYGRLYGTIGSFERLEKECRGTICREYYHDIDIINAHPVFLYQFALNVYNKPLLELEKYIANRDAYLQKISDNRDEAKQQVISLLYGGKPQQDFLIPFHKEIREFTKFLLHQQTFEDLKDAVKNEDNLYGTFLSYILHTIEREIMLTMKKSLEDDGWNVDVLAYDGVMVRRNKDLDLQASMKNAEKQVFDKFGLKINLLDKEMSYFDVPNAKEEIVAGVLKDDYLQMKMDFETNHFYFIPTNQYAEIENGVINMYDLNHATEYFKAKWRFTVSDKFDDYVEFFKLWRIDPNRKMIKVIDYKPSDDPYVFVPSLDFAYKNYTCEPNQEAVDYFLKIIRSNTNNDDILYNWVIRFFAHMLQKPFEVPKIAVVFTGEKGTGKDTPVDFLMEYVIGRTFSQNYQSNHQFFDRYDCGRANKFLIKLEEADRKACLSESSYLKSLITADNNTFNPKGKNAYNLPNYNRFVFTTNKANPMEVSGDERRYVILGGSTTYKGNHSFWSSVHQELFTQAGGLAVAQYLLNLDISDFNVREMPKNKYMDDVIESEKSSEERFVDSWEGKGEAEALSSSELFSQYRMFCVDNDLPYVANSAILGKAMLKFVRDGVVKNERKTGNKNYYWKEPSKPKEN